jgi:chromosome segregation ATPase
MSDVLDLMIRSVPILIGGGVVQLAMFLLKRRSELRVADATAAKTEAESGSVVVSSAERSVQLSDALRDDAVKRAAMLLGDLDIQLERVRRLNARLSEAEAEVEDLRAEVGTLRREVTTLRAAAV